MKSNYSKHREKYKEICANCGFTFGSHCGRAYYSNYYNMQIPEDACPGHEGRMDWDKGGGTVFKSKENENNK